MITYLTIKMKTFVRTDKYRNFSNRPTTNTNVWCIKFLKSCFWDSCLINWNHRYQIEELLVLTTDENCKFPLSEPYFKDVIEIHSIYDRKDIPYIKISHPPLNLLIYTDPTTSFLNPDIDITLFSIISSMVS